MKPGRARRRTSPITRLGGVAAQFRPSDGGYVYRKDGAGPPIEVSSEERDGFVRASMWMLAVHAGLFGLALGGVALLAPRLEQRFGMVGGAALLAVLGCAAAAILYATFRWTTHAPARALAHRPVSVTAGPADPATPPSYATIIAGAVVVLIWSAFKAGTSPRLAVVLAVSTLLVAPAVAILAWRARGRLTPEHRSRLAAAQAAEREAARRQRDIRGALLMLAFLAIELAVLAGGLVLGVQAMLAASGSSWDDADGLVMVGGGLGLIVGALAVWPIDALGKRLTGSSALDILRDLPPF